MERHPRHIYEQLKETASDPDNLAKGEELTSHMNDVFQKMMDLVDQHQENKNKRIEAFKERLGAVMANYWEGPFLGQIEEIGLLQEQNDKKWKEIEKRMEALNQIKNIYRQSFGHFGRQQ